MALNINPTVVNFSNALQVSRCLLASLLAILILRGADSLLTGKIFSGTFPGRWDFQTIKTFVCLLCWFLNRCLLFFFTTNSLH